MYGTFPLFAHPPIRCHYYASVTGDDDKLDDVRAKLWKIGFMPSVFKKNKEQTRAEGVDIALTKDMLSHAFGDHYDVAVLLAGDGDYVPLVEKLSDRGKIVCVSFFEAEEAAMSPRLKAACDYFLPVDMFFRMMSLEIAAQHT